MAHEPRRAVNRRHRGTTRSRASLEPRFNPVSASWTFAAVNVIPTGAQRDDELWAVLRMARKRKKGEEDPPEAEEAYGAKNSAKRLARLYEFIR